MGAPQLGMKGLRLLPNHFTVERGGTLVADNCVIPSKDVLEPRRGQPKQQSMGSSSARARAFHMFQNTMLAWRDTDNVLAYDTSGGSGTFTALSGTYSPPAPTLLRMKFADMAKSTYFTTSAAPYALSSYNGTPRAAGLPRPQDFYVIDPASALVSQATALNGNPGDGWMSVNTAVGYRAVIGLRDANSVIRLSAPSGRTIIQNPADIAAAIGALVRTGGNLVTVTASHSYRRGDIFALSPGEGNFAAGNKTVTGVTSTTFTYAEAGANVASTLLQNLTSGLKNVVAGVLLPPGLTAGQHFVQLYRTLMVPGSGSDPLDEMRQVFERYVTSTDISNGYLVITDTCPESSFRGPNLYTNPVSGGGTDAANARPPIANDICVWDNRMWYGQTTDRQRLTFRLLGIGSPSGIQTGDILCFGPNAFKAGTDFTVSSQWTPSQNLSLTIAAIVYRHNKLSLVTPTSYLYALDDGSVYPPSFLFEELGVGGSTTYAACSRSSAVSERLPGVATVTVASSSRTSNVVTITAPSHGFTTGDSIMLATSFPDANFLTGVKTSITVTGANTFTYAETGSNAVMTGTFYVYATTYPSDNNRLPLRYSKQLEAEACPLLNYPTGLPDNATVLRIKALGAHLFIFLQYGDVYVASGSWPYSVQKLPGSTAQLLAADTLEEHAGRLHCLSTQGLIAVSSGGVEILSYNVEPGLDPLEGTALSTIQTQAFAVSYESDRQYQLWLPSGAGVTSCSQAYVYNSLVRDWTRWVQSTVGGIWNPVTGKLVLGAGDENTLRIENKAYARADYLDDINSVIISDAGGATVTYAGATIAQLARISVGDFVDTALLSWHVSFPTTPVKVVSVNTGTKVITYDAATFGDFCQGDIAAVVPHYHPISTPVSLVPDFAMAPDIEKQWREAKFHFAFFDVQTPAPSFATETQTTAVPAPPTAGTWPDYSGALEAAALPPVVLRCDVPEQCERGVLLYSSFSVNEPKALWRLCGVTSTSEMGSERTGK